MPFLLGVEGEHILIFVCVHNDDDDVMIMQISAVLCISRGSADLHNCLKGELRPL